MKPFLAFSSVVLLVSLAIADDQPTAKFLYDSDFVIAESIEFPFTNLEYAHYEDYNGGYLKFMSRNNNTDHFFERMNIEKGFEKQTSNFTIEVYSKYAKDYIPAFDHFCKDNSSEALRGLIRDCWARTLLREMTVEEQEQMRRFKEEQKKTPTRGKVIFGRNRQIQMKVPDTARDAAMSSDVYNYGVTTDNRTIYYTSFDKRITWVSMTYLEQRLPKRFVIEGLPDESGVNCNQSEFRYVKPADCNEKEDPLLL